MSNKPCWFPAKTHGWGWGWGLPCAWQGWVVLGAYMALGIWLALQVGPDFPLAHFGVAIGIASAILVAICWVKGERPRWR